MFYRVELLNKFKQGRFSESWLAATCPTLFRRNYRKSHVVKISVPKICGYIQEMWNTNSNQVNERLSLFLAAQLLYGTVCIYQQQVHFLYEITLELFYLERLLTKLIRTNISRKNDKTSKKKKLKLVQKCPKLTNQQSENNFLMEDYGLVVCRSQQSTCDQKELEKSVQDLLQEPDIVGVPNASITLLEEPITSFHEMVVEVHPTEQQIFNGPEYCEFMNFNEEVQPAKRTKLQETPSSILEVPLEKRSKILYYSNLNLQESSLDLINRVNRSVNPLGTTNSFDNFYPNTGSTPMREFNQRDPLLEQFGNLSKPLNTIVSENTVESTLVEINQLPSLVEPIQPQSVVDQLQLTTPEKIKDAMLPNPKRGKADKKKLVIDSTIEITNQHYFNNIDDYTLNTRVLHPTDDILSIWEMEFMRELFLMPANKILAVPLYNDYKRSLITKPVAVDTEVFVGLLNIFEVAPPQQNYNRRRGSKRTHDNQIVKVIKLPNVPLEIPLPVETEVNLPQIELAVPMESEINVRQTTAIETTDIPSLFSANMSGLTDSMAKQYFSKIEIYRHLVILWSHKVYPIGMRTLCANLKKRKYVAMVFYSLMCLQNEGKIKLICNLNDREIYHIQPVY